jgi:hypothetical protein
VKIIRIDCSTMVRLPGIILCWGHGMFWTRWLDTMQGRGFWIKDARRCRPLFSERNGYARTWRIGPFTAGALSRD